MSNFLLSFFFLREGYLTLLRASVRSPRTRQNGQLLLACSGCLAHTKVATPTRPRARAHQLAPGRPVPYPKMELLFVVTVYKNL